MTKIEIITFEYERCADCPNVDGMVIPHKGGWYCMLSENREVPDMWGDIPSWCPLPDKEGR